MQQGLRETVKMLIQVTEPRIKDKNKIISSSVLPSIWQLPVSMIMCFLSG